MYMTKLYKVGEYKREDKGLCMESIGNIRIMNISKKNIDLAILLCKEGSAECLHDYLLNAKSEKMGLEAYRRHLHNCRGCSVSIEGLKRIYNYGDDYEFKNVLEYMFLKPISWNFYIKALKSLKENNTNIDKLHEKHSEDLCRPITNILIEISCM